MDSHELANRLLRLNMALTENGSPLTPALSEARQKRNNTSRGIRDFLPGPGWSVPRSPLLWVVDRIMDPHTVSAHFFQFLADGCLPGGRHSSLPLLKVVEVGLITKPPSEWAPAPFNQETRSTCDWLMARAGSYEDGDRLQIITKELHGMKMRIWEGLPPLSERRWQELGLDHPDNFRWACRYIVRVIDVFNYLNHPRVKDALRTTYNLMWDHLKKYEDALNAKRRLESEDGAFTELNVTGMWYQYVRAHYDMICNHAHRWVIQHIDRLREPVIQEMAHHQPPHPTKLSERQWELTNKIQDLGENTAQADFTIFMPTDGYKGDALPAKDQEPLTAAHRGGFREEPIRWSATHKWRQSDYIKRVRYLDRKNEHEAWARHNFADLGPHIPLNNPASLLVSCLSQVEAQVQARYELRGVSEPPDMDYWMEWALKRQSVEGFGFVAYKLCHGRDSQWEDFKTKLEADISDWGRDKKGIGKVRQLCEIHWIDGQEKEIADGDIDGAREHFKTLKGTIKRNELWVQKDVFLAVDEAVMESYLEPSDDNAHFLVAVDASYDTSDKNTEETPYYKGTLRILGSLLWDELAAMTLRRSISLKNLWPMAMTDPERIYRGQMVTPVFKFPSHVEFERWVLACATVPRLAELKRRVDSMGRNQGRPW